MSEKSVLKQSREMAKMAVEALKDHKAEDIRAIDISDVSVSRGSYFSGAFNRAQTISTMISRTKPGTA